MENGYRGHRIDGRDERSEREALHETQLVRHLRQAENVYTGADDERRYGGADDGEHQYGTDVLEEIALVQVVTGFKYDWRQEDEEEGRWRERFFVAPIGDVLFGHEIDDQPDDGPEEYDDHAFGQVLEMRGQHEVYEQYAQGEDAEHEKDGDRTVALLLGRPFFRQHRFARRDGRYFFCGVGRRGLVGRRVCVRVTPGYLGTDGFVGDRVRGAGPVRRLRQQFDRHRRLVGGRLVGARHGHDGDGNGRQRAQDRRQNVTSGGHVHDADTYFWAITTAAAAAASSGVREKHYHAFTARPLLPAHRTLRRQ